MNKLNLEKLQSYQQKARLTDFINTNDQQATSNTKTDQPPQHHSLGGVIGQTYQLIEHHQINNIGLCEQEDDDESVSVSDRKEESHNDEEEEV